MSGTTGVGVTTDTFGTRSPPDRARRTGRTRAEARHPRSVRTVGSGTCGASVAPAFARQLDRTDGRV